MARSRNESGSEFQTVGPVTEKVHRCQKCCNETVEYSVATAGRTKMLAAGNFGYWYAAVRGSLVLCTENTDEQ